MKDAEAQATFAEIVRRFYPQHEEKNLETLGWMKFASFEDWNEKLTGLKSRYVGKDYIPIFFRDDADDVICIDDQPEKSNFEWIVNVHDFADAGWEDAGRWPDLSSWFEEVSSGYGDC